MQDSPILNYLVTIRCDMDAILDRVEARIDLAE